MDQDDWIRPPKSGEVNNNTSVIIANDESKKTSTRTKTNRGIRRRFAGSWFLENPIWMRF
jgi:hypothetical protein